jgi:methyl-accepting chemotaxis protein
MNLLRNTRIGIRLLLGYGAVILLLLAMAGVTVWKAEGIRATSELMEIEAGQLSLAERWHADVRQNSARSLAVARSPGRDMFEFFKEAMAATSRETTETQKQYLANATDPESKRLADDVGAVRKEWLGIRDDINRQKEAGNDAAAVRLVDERLVPATGRYLKATEALVAWQLKKVEAIHHQEEASIASLYTWLAATVLAAIATAIGIALAITRSVTVPLTQATAAADKIGAGDLTPAGEVSGSDEVAQLLRALSAAQQSLARPCSRSAPAWTRSPPPAARSPPATRTCPAAPSSRPATCSRRPPRWSR